MSDDYELFGQDLEEASQDLSSYAENHAQCPAPLPSLQPATSGPAAACGKTVLSWVPGALALDMGASQACASCSGHSCSSWSSCLSSGWPQRASRGPRPCPRLRVALLLVRWGLPPPSKEKGPQICLYFHSLLDPCPERSSSSRGIQSPRRQRRKVLRQRETGGIPR